MFDLPGEVRTADDDVAAALAYARSVAGRSHAAEDVATRWALAHPEAARLAAARPGPALTWRLTHLAVADAPSEDLLEAVGAWERTAAWVAAEQARVLQELQRRVAASTWAQKGLREDVAGTLTLSGRAAGILLDRARELTAAPEVHDALRSGVLSVRKADVILRDTGFLSSSEARCVHDALIEQAPLLTAPQLGAAARRAVLELDPDAAEARHRQAREERCVVLEPAADCMATIRAYLPATDAVRAMRALDAVAAAASPEDPRGIDARRADALVDVLAAVLDTGVIVPDGGPRRRTRRAPRLNLTISTDALAGATSTPGFLDGYGPVLPSLARRLAHEAAWHFVRTDPATGEALEQPGSRYRPPEALRSAIIARDVTCTFPGCRVSAQVCDLDHTVPFDDTRDPAEQTRRSNLTALCRHHHRLKTHGRWTPRRERDTGVVVWTSPTGKPYTRQPVPAPGEPPPGPRGAGGSLDGTDQSRPPGEHPPGPPEAGGSLDGTDQSRPPGEHPPGPPEAGGSLDGTDPSSRPPPF